MSRTSNSLRNAGAAIGGQLLNNLLRFACRTVFLYTLGQEYLGISGLYSNVITILSVSELGFSTAVTYSLYEPLSTGDQGVIRAIMGFYRNAYRIIAMIVLGLGLLLMPALPHLMTGVTDKVNIYHYYLLYLAETVVSYLFFSYKSVLLIADQKKYKVDVISYICQVATNVVQMVILVVWRSFLWYTVMFIINGVVTNIVTALVVNRRYPYLRGKAPKLDPEKRKAILNRVYATGLNKLSVTVGTSGGSLIISSFVSVLAAGIYSNYSMIVQIFQKLLSGIFAAMTSSLGNLYATESRERNVFMFRSLNLMNNLLVTVCSVCFLVLFQPFIALWAGEEYLFSYGIVIAIVLNFATNYLQNVVQIYREACGIFVRGKYRPVFTAALNLGLSILLVQKMGIAGVFCGAILSRMVTAWWFDAWLLHRVAFGVSPARYFAECGLTLGLTAGCTLIVKLLFRSVAEPGWIVLIAMGLVSAALVCAAYLAIYGRSPEFAYWKDKARELLPNKKA